MQERKSILQKSKELVSFVEILGQFLTSCRSQVAKSMIGRFDAIQRNWLLDDSKDLQEDPCESHYPTHGDGSNPESCIGVDHRTHASQQSATL